MNISADIVMITRGSQMAIYLASKILLKPDDKVAVGETNYPSANLCFRSFGASLVRIPVDRHGINVNVLEERLVKDLKIL